MGGRRRSPEVPPLGSPPTPPPPSPVPPVQQRDVLSSRRSSLEALEFERWAGVFTLPVQGGGQRSCGKGQSVGPVRSVQVGNF